MWKEKSLLVAYLCWLTGGFFGLHHFYLGRDKHAFITFATLGGYFSLGLIRDLWRLPEYVREANNDPGYLDKLHLEIRTNKKPPSSFVRQSGLMMVGNLFAYLVDYAIPTELLNDNVSTCLKYLLIPFAAALGVWLTGNVGRHRGTIKYPLFASYLAALPSLFFKIQIGSISTLAAVIIFNKYCKKWRLQREQPKSVVRRFSVLLLCMILYLIFWSSWLYFNCTIKDEDTGEEIRCRDAALNFFKSPAYTNLTEAVWMIVEHARHRGFIGLWKEIMQEFDMTGRSNAFATLGLPENASPSDIVAQYRKLSREYHPDKEKDESKKAEKHEKFIEVQQAYSLLEPTVKKFKDEL